MVLNKPLVDSNLNFTIPSLWSLLGYSMDGIFTSCYIPCGNCLKLLILYIQLDLFANFWTFCESILVGFFCYLEMYRFLLTMHCSEGREIKLHPQRLNVGWFSTFLSSICEEQPFFALWERKFVLQGFVYSSQLCWRILAFFKGFPFNN